MSEKETAKTIALFCLILALLAILFLRAAATPAEKAAEPSEIRPPVEETPAWMAERVTIPAPLLEVVIEREDGDSTGGPVTVAAPVAPVDETLTLYRPDVPMPIEHQTALYEACAESGVEIPVALGLVELESTFNPNAVSSTGCYGYCQLSRYFPKGLSPEENLRAGIGWLGELIAQYGDVAAALTAYHLGRDDGTRDYADVVLRYASKWEAET